MWLDPIGAEQATAEPVARHKSLRFAGDRVFDLCSGIGGDSLGWPIIRTSSRWMPAHRWDDARAGTPGPMAWVIVSSRCRHGPRPSRFPGVPSSISILTDEPDPDPRPSDRRLRAGTRFPTRPSLSMRWRRHQAGPGQPVRSGVPVTGPRDRAHQPGRRVQGSHSMVRRPGDLPAAGHPFTRGRDLDRPRWKARALCSVSAVSAWIYDPDPALLRAGLLESFAAAHGMSRCGQGVDYLTCPHRVESPWLDAFEVLDVLPLHERNLRRLIRERRLGPLEIKTRQSLRTPESWRTLLRPPGPNPATLILWSGRDSSRAVLASRV